MIGVMDRDSIWMTPDLSIKACIYQTVSKYWLVQVSPVVFGVAVHCLLLCGEPERQCTTCRFVLQKTSI